jgi:hypothetical protein
MEQIALTLLMIVAAGAVVFLDPKSQPRQWVRVVAERVTQDGLAGVYELLLETTRAMSDRTPAPSGDITLPAWVSPGYSDADAAVPGIPARVPVGVGAMLEGLALADAIDGRRDALRFPLGYVLDHDGAAVLMTATFTPRLPASVKHIGITGQTDTGKDTFFTNAALSLMQRATPDDVQFTVLDGKDLDYVGWEHLPHVWATPTSKGGVDKVMLALDAELRRRKAFLNRKRIKSWAEYRERPTFNRDPLPLMVVYISELTSLTKHIKALPDLGNGQRLKLFEWMNDMLATGRAYGLYFIVGSTSFANTPTLWRKQFQMRVAGPLESRFDDQPSTNYMAAELIKLGAVPPSELPLAPGYFTVCYARGAMNVRAGYPAPGEEAAVLASFGVALPEPEPEDVSEAAIDTPEAVSAPISGAETAEPDPVLAELDALLATAPDDVRTRAAAHGLRLVTAADTEEDDDLSYAPPPGPADVPSPDALEAERLRIAVEMVKAGVASPTDATEIAYGVARSSSARFQEPFARVNAELARQNVQRTERRGRPRRAALSLN